LPFFEGRGCRCRDVGGLIRGSSAVPPVVYDRMTILRQLLTQLLKQKKAPMHMYVDYLLRLRAI
jgi:hypothetical protein